MKTEPQLRQ